VSGEPENRDFQVAAKRAEGAGKSRAINGHHPPKSFLQALRLRALRCTGQEHDHVAQFLRTIYFCASWCLFAATPLKGWN
jgi:hypothetical protein